MVTAGAPVVLTTEGPRVPHWSGHAAAGLLAVALFAVLHLTTGRLEVGDGEGWDGADYARMLREGWSGGSIHTQLRPLIVWADTPAFMLTGSAVRAFDAMNYLYALALAVVLSLLLERYGADFVTRLIVVGGLAITNSFRLFAFYPVMIDLGAAAVMAVALWCLIAGPRWAATLACVAAVLAREYAPILLFFGVHRDLRTGTRLPTIVATYLPATLAWLALRIAVTRAWAGVEDGTTLDVLLENRELWADPMFAALFFYFVLTIGGGLSLAIAARPRCAWTLLRREPEWASYAIPLVAVTALGGADLWRYLTPLLPVVAVFYAWCARGSSAVGRTVTAMAALALTWWTQSPLKRMDLASYFADWFPYYIWMRQYPFPSSPPSLWPDWGWRFLVVALALVALTAWSARHEAPGVPL